MSAHDDRLVDQLRAVATRLDPPPAALAEAARAALAWRTIDAELAELSYDSVTDDRELVGVRGETASPRLISFEADGLTIEVEVSAQGGSRRVMGQVVPMQPVRVEIRHGSGVAVAEADDLGRFRAESVPAGSISLRCHVGTGDSARTVNTDWVTI